MMMQGRSALLASAVVLGLAAAGGVARAQSEAETTTEPEAQSAPEASTAAAEASTAAASCPVTHQALKGALNRAVEKVSFGFNNEMWAVVVNRAGVVCAVAFSGDSRTDQWLLSRQIAAAKAFTANGLSLDIDGSGSGPLSTAQLYPLVQPGGTLFGLEAGNPLNPAAAYRGPFGRWGTPDDPMVGKRVGGTITFGGGVGLYRGRTKAAGGLGLSGDTACADDAIARAVRQNLGLVPSKSDEADFGSKPGQHPAC
jgi:uncharacterized protein GlcG (DUF336 family)